MYWNDIQPKSLFPNSVSIYPHSLTLPTFESSFHCFLVHFVLPLYSWVEPSTMV